MSKRKIIFMAVGAVLTALVVMASAVFSHAVVNRSRYPVFGVDVSNYQGVINWEKLEEQGVRFAFIKATEGSGHTDESVRRNLQDSADTGIKRSCYHFFSFDSSGHTQAQNFISAVGREEIDMPPVVDIEYYADKALNKPSVEETGAILLPLLEELEAYYGEKPIIYTTIPVYYRYVKELCSNYPLWIRCTQMEPEMVSWTFWQYDDHGILDGYYGDEEHIDFNVYSGSEEDFNTEFAIRN